MASNLINALLICIVVPFASAAVNLSRQAIRFPHTFTYEAQTPQKVTTGCRGTLFPESKETHQIFYVLDATGTIKYVEPGSTVQVIFPFVTDGTINYPHKRQMVRFTEICFPSQCNAPSCGNIVGPLTYAETNEKTPTATVEVTHVNTETGSGSTSTILQTFTSHATQSIQPGNAAAALTQPVFHSSSASSTATSSVPAVEAGSSGTTTGSEPIAPAISALVQPLIMTQSETVVLDAPNSDVPMPEVPPAAIAVPPPSHQPAVAQAVLTSSTSTFSTDSSQASVAASDNLEHPEGKPSFTQLGQLVPEVKPEALPAPSTLTSAVINTFVNADKPEVPVTLPQGSSSTLSTSTVAFGGQSQGYFDCPASCSCCSGGPSQHSTNTVTSSTVGSGPVPVMPSWPSWFPFPWSLTPAVKPIATNKVKALPVVGDASYYASLPGAIRGSTHVIYYPSCDRDAYYQPAIVNFCSYPFPPTAYSYGKVTESRAS